MFLLGQTNSPSLCQCNLAWHCQQRDWYEEFKQPVATISLTSVCSSREDNKWKAVINYKAAVIGGWKQETETGQGIGSKNCIRAGLKGLCVRMFVFINMHMHVFMSMCV